MGTGSSKETPGDRAMPTTSTSKPLPSPSPSQRTDPPAAAKSPGTLRKLGTSPRKFSKPFQQGEIRSQSSPSQGTPKLLRALSIRSQQKPLAHKGGPLSQDQLEAVILGWQQVEDLDEFCCRVFIQIFMHKPNLKRLFHLETVPVDQLRSNPQFSRHARNFGEFLSNLTKYLMSDDGPSDQNELSKLIVVIGERHVAVTKDLQFDTEYWKLFVASVIDQMSEILSGKFSQKECKKVLESWRVFLNWVESKMRMAYYRKLEKEYKQKMSTASAEPLHLVSSTAELELETIDV